MSKFTCAKALSLIFFALFWHQAPATSDENSSHAKYLQEQIKKFKLNESDLGVLVLKNGSDSPIMDLNANKKFIPASITKIFTAYGILKTLPPGHKFSTRLLTNGKVENGVLKGDLYLLGGGDPGFVSEGMWFLVNAFVRNEIREISGDIIVDDSLFDTERFDLTREDNRVDRAYDSPVGAMSFNWNSVNVFIRSGESATKKPRVFLDPENNYTRLENNLKQGAKNDIRVDRVKINAHSGDLIRLTGQVSEKSKETVVFKNITNPALWSGENLVSFLKQRNVLVKGKVREGRAPHGARELAIYESKPVEQHVADMNKFSNNYVAEMLTKNIVAFRGEQGSIGKGVEIIKSHLDALGLSSKDYEFYNPSGLTRKNKGTPLAYIKVLKAVREDFQIFPEFLSSLPIAGVDGTLKSRFKNGSAARWVRAKTGLLTGVVSLAGYASDKKGTIYSFVFIYNGGRDGSEVRQFFDNLIGDMIQ